MSTDSPSSDLRVSAFQFSAFQFLDLPTLLQSSFCARVALVRYDANQQQLNPADMKTAPWMLTWIAGTFVSVHCTGPAYASVIFSQDFSSSPNGPVSAYVNSASPNSGQWNAVGSSGSGVTVAVANGSLQYTRATANVGSFSRTTDFSPAPDALIYKFDLTVSLNSVAQTSAAVWQVGSGFGTANAAETVGLVHSRFAINFTSTPGTFQFREISGSDSVNFSGPQSVTWVINNSGSTLSYLAPDSTMQTIGNDKWELWAGNTLVFSERAATISGQSLTDLKFAFADGSGAISMDNFQITAIPEPTTIALGLFATGLVTAGGLRQSRHRRTRQTSDL